VGERRVWEESGFTVLDIRYPLAAWVRDSIFLPRTNFVLITSKWIALSSNLMVVFILVRSYPAIRTDLDNELLVRTHPFFIGCKVVHDYSSRWYTRAEIRSVLDDPSDTIR